MNWLIAILSLSMGNDPPEAWEVPPAAYVDHSTVESPPLPTVERYIDLLARVKAGESLVLDTTNTTGVPDSILPGKWKCWNENGITRIDPSALVVSVPTPTVAIRTPEVVPVITFPATVTIPQSISHATAVHRPSVTVVAGIGQSYDPDHQCNNCGRPQNVVDRFNPDGTHSHKCSTCGNVWKH
jgi:hypothetical protein